MNWPRWYESVAIVVLVALVVGACAGRADETEPDGVNHALIVPDYLVVRAGDQGAVETALPGAIVRDLDAAVIGELLDDRYGGPLIQGGEGGLTEGDDGVAAELTRPGSLAESVLKRLRLIVLPEGVDARQALRQLRTDPEPIEAHALHLYEFDNHYTVQPSVLPQFPVGDAARANSIRNSVERFEPGDPRILAIVDSGFVEGTPSVDFDPRLDREIPDGNEACFASHGTFVATVIRQVAPNVETVGTRAAPLTIDSASKALPAEIEENEHHEGARPQAAGSDTKGFADNGCNPIHDDNGEIGHDRPLTDDFAILAAISRAHERADTTRGLGTAPVVMSWSFGTFGFVIEAEEHPDDTPEYVPPLVLEATVDALTAQGVRVYAAAGNQTVDSPFYPAAFDDVVGVGAMTADGDWVRWNDDTTPEAKARGERTAWTDAFAPGCNLVGLARTDLDELVLWSGSSFATPIAAALDTSAGPASPLNGRVVADYSDLPAQMDGSAMAGATSQCPDRNEAGGPLADVTCGLFNSWCDDRPGPNGVWQLFVGLVCVLILSARTARERLGIVEQDAGRER